MAKICPTVQRDDTMRVHHFCYQHYVVRRLENLHVLVVATGRDWGPGIKSKDASIVRTPV